MMLLQSSCFPRREESAGRAENILSASSDSKTTSPYPRAHRALFFCPFPSQEDLMLWLVLGWCLALKGEPCWLSHREVGSWFPTPPPWASARPGRAANRAVSRHSIPGQWAEGEQLSHLQFVPAKAFWLSTPRFHKHWFHGKNEVQNVSEYSLQIYLKIVL